MLRFGRSSLALAALLACSGQGLAQSEADFVRAFAGDWEVYDSRFSGEKARCRLSLKSDATEGRYLATPVACQGKLSEVTGWKIVDSQMSLFDRAGSFVMLGGNQRRMSGADKAGVPVVLERVGGVNAGTRLNAAVKTYGCYYLGLTNTCAPAAALAIPPAAGDGKIQVNVLSNLNVRSEPRDNAGVVGVVPAKTCVSVNLCVRASDGVWCRAEFGERTGWLRKLALRQDRWPIVTYVNGCPAASGG